MLPGIMPRSPSAARTAPTGYPYVLTEVVLTRHIAVVTVHCFHLCIKCHRQYLGHRSHDMCHHDGTISHRESLRPVHGLHVVTEMLGTLGQVSQVLIRQVDVPLPHIVLGQLNKVATDAVTHTTRSAMQHEPHSILFIQTHFHEVVAGTQRTQMLNMVRLRHLRVLLSNPGKLVTAIHLWMKGKRATFKTCSRAPSSNGTPRVQAFTGTPRPESITL